MARAMGLVLLVTGCGFADIVDDRVGAIDADLARLEQRLGELEVENTDLRARLEAVEATTGTSGWIMEEETWVIPGEHDTLDEALAAAADVRIWSSGQLTLQLEDGAHTLASRVDFRHPDGDRVRILGNTADPTRVVVSCPAEGCIQVSWGTQLAMLDGMVLTGTGAGQGIRSSYDGRVTLGSALWIQDFDLGIVCTTGAVVRGNSILLAGNRFGAVADAGGILDLQRVRVEGGAVGLAAEPAGLVVTSGATVDGAFVAFKARGGRIWAPRSTVLRADGVGLLAAEGGLIIGTATRVTESTVAYQAIDGGLLATGNPISELNDRDVVLENGAGAFLPEPTFSDAPGSIEVSRRSVLVTQGFEAGVGTIVTSEEGVAFGP